MQSSLLLSILNGKYQSSEQLFSKYFVYVNVILAFTKKKKKKNLH